MCKPWCGRFSGGGQPRHLVRKCKHSYFRALDDIVILFSPPKTVHAGKRIRGTQCMIEHTQRDAGFVRIIGITYTSFPKVRGRPSQRTQQINGIMLGTMVFENVW